MGIEGLKDRTKKAVDLPELSKETSYQIKKELKESNQKAGPQNRGGRVNHKEKRDKISLYSTYTVSFENGDLNRRCQERCCMLIPHPKEEKDNFKKRLPRYLWINRAKATSNSKKQVCRSITWTNHSSFYDSLDKKGLD